MVKLADYVVEFLADHGMHDVFLASGGNIMHLLDAVARNPEVNYFCNYHEQACVVAAEGHARLTGRIAACMCTAGPGAINALSGVVAAWVDSVPLFVISGQVRSDLTADYAKVRQVGSQEANVVDMARPATKYAVSVRDPKTIRYHLERALYEATTGRPGPVWIEIPVTVQGMTVQENELEGFQPPSASDEVARKQKLTRDAALILEALRSAKRPVIIPGNGVHYAGARDLLRTFVDRMHIPVLLPLTAKDLLEEEHPLQMGVFGGTGQRRANFTVQNSDCVLALAAGLNVQKIGFNVAAFAPRARKIVVDIDSGQLENQILKPDVPIQADVRELLAELLRQSEGADIPPKQRWLDACAHWKCRYPVMTPDYYADPDHINTYVFMDTLSDHLTPNDILVTGNGTDVVSYYQAFRVKRGQRTLNTGWGSMGWDLPIAVGACIGGGRRRTICATGDGSVQWNIQEMMTIGHYRLPIKLFIFNNQGYTCIRSTQDNFFEGRYAGADATSGVANPDFCKLAAAYGWQYHRILRQPELSREIGRALAMEGPVLCEINVAVGQGISPKATAFRRPDGTLESRPLEDMAPFLPREEVSENMHMFDGEDE
jgi:acetolactate synthase-1/2/3 large subunit